MNANVSAYVPCCNNAATVRAAVESVLAQSLAPAEVLVVDDGSRDDSLARLAGLPVRVIRNERNLGRGPVRARAMAEARHEFVLCCDATNRLPPDFAARALAVAADPQVAAVFGPIRDPAPRGVAGRWRARHVFKQDAMARRPRRRATLATYGALLRRSAAQQVGGYDATLRHSEDADLGARLLAAGFDVVYDPELATFSNVQNSLGEVLERYWRWSIGRDEEFSPARFSRHAWYAVRTMAAADLAARDLASAGVSIALPAFLLVKTLARRISGERQRPTAQHDA